MANISPQEIEELKRQMKEKKEEIKAIYNKLVEAGAVPLPDDILENIAGGLIPTSPPIPSLPPSASIRPW
ncbi:MAG: hypothetical protein J6W07_01375 [Bacteroidales bacterium]|nr:hypothetical protein [Bacteroidales bacterium]